MNNNRNTSNGRVNGKPNYSAQRPTVPPGQNGTRGAQTAGRPQQTRNTRQSPQQRPVAQPRSGTNQRPVQNGSQNAARRNMHMTAEQAAINRTSRRNEKHYSRRRAKYAVGVFFRSALLFGVLFAIIGCLSAVVFYVNLTYSEAEDSSRYSYIIDGQRSTLSYKNAVRDGRVYVSFTDVAKMCGLAVTGSDSDMKFVIKGDEAETIRFITDSREVYVNGIGTRLGSECYRINDELYVPVDFVSAYFNGLDVTVDESGHKVTVDRIITNLDENGKLPKNTEAEYAELSFLLKAPDGIEPISEEEEIDATMPDLGFVTNLAAYEPYMNPGNTMEFLTVVSVNNKLPSDYAPQDVVPVINTRTDNRKTQLMRENAAMALEAMFIELEAAGFNDVSVTSAYRSYAYQETLFNQYLAQYNNNYDYVMTFSNPPGSSEHQTGLCADLHNLPSADIAFAQTEAYTWLRHNCWKFGFILRYPKDKVDVTGISFEPWHYRYVGRYHAQRIYEAGMCLEEYVEYIGENP